MVTAPARRELVRWMGTRGLTERRALAVMAMSASSLRYEPRPDQNVALRARIVALAQRHRRYGSPMIYLKLRQAGEIINHKRVERLYGLEKLHISISSVAGARRYRLPIGSLSCVPAAATRSGPWTLCLIASPRGARSRTW
jgi:hypothetical protein